MSVKCKVAVPQWEQVWFDKEATTQKAIGLIKEAAANDAKLIAFGELAIPGYPTYLYGGRMNDCYEHGIRYFNNAIEIDGPEIAALRAAAKENNIIVHTGFAEKDGKSLYMGNVIIDENGEVLLHRRKIKPSHYERVLFGEGGPESAINTVDTSIGRISTLNCWEHFQPLLKYHTYSQRPYIHIASWPLLHPYGGKEQWSHCNESGVGVTRTVAIEAGAFVLNCSSIIIEKGLELNRIQGISIDGVPDAGHIIEGGGMSAVYAPDGSQVTKSIPDNVEEMVYATVDPDRVHFAALVQDVVGHYSRPDIFQLVVKNAPSPRVAYRAEDGSLIHPPSRIKPFKDLSPNKGVPVVNGHVEA